MNSATPTATTRLFDYVLPDGRVVQVAGISLPAIPYQLVDGRVVTAALVSKVVGEKTT